MWLLGPGAHLGRDIGLISPRLTRARLDTCGIFKPQAWNQLTTYNVLVLLTVCISRRSKLLREWQVVAEGWLRQLSSALPTIYIRW